MQDVNACVCAWGWVSAATHMMGSPFRAMSRVKNTRSIIKIYYVANNKNKNEAKGYVSERCGQLKLLCKSVSTAPTFFVSQVDGRKSAPSFLACKDGRVALWLTHTTHLCALMGTYHVRISNVSARMTMRCWVLNFWACGAQHNTHASSLPAHIPTTHTEAQPRHM